MSVRHKIISFMVAFFVTIVIMASGVLYIFNILGDNLVSLRSQVQRHRIHADLRSHLLEFFHAASGWALTGEGQYRTLYQDSQSSINKIFGDIDSYAQDRLFLEEVGTAYQDARVYAREIILNENPAGNIRVLNALTRMEVHEEEILEVLDTHLHRTLDNTADVIMAGEQVRRNLTFYLSVLIGFGVLASGFLILLIKRMLEEPYNEMLRATAKVSGGDLGYRIHSRSRDEFGLIASRFDKMVENLETSDTMVRRKLGQTELLLDVAQIAGKTPDLKEALLLMMNTIAEKMKLDVCAVYLIDEERKTYELESANTPEANIGTMLTTDSMLAVKLNKEKKPVFLPSVSDDSSVRRLAGRCSSIMVVPLLRDDGLRGLILMGSYIPKEFSSDELDTAVIIAHTVASTVRNIDLYGAAKRQLKQLGIVYELSRTLTSVFKSEELLDTITSETAKLINAKGCLIRLVENGVLRVKSMYGPMSEGAKELEVPLGEGIAGLVALEGRALLVEDVSQLPEDVRAKSALVAKSAIAVPLKVGERIIGTLGLYDKFDERGTEVPFTHDDLDVAQGFASISAVAIETARMQERELQSRTQILDAKKRLDLLFESVQGGIITLDRNFKITAANNYIQRWIDKPHADIIGKDALKVFHENGGICPHCAARVTLEAGEVNSITQSSGLNYAELSSYPLKDEKGEITEAVVFIQDITDRVLYQEEIMGLYREVMQTKEYMESLIANSADAIVTSDLDGVVKSWNPAAERIYGYTSEEAIGAFLPFVPGSLLEFEEENRKKIGRGEGLKLETIRTRKDGKLIEVSLTLSPIKDVTGEIIGISGISRDITDKKRVEKELIRRNQELSRLFFISSAMRGTLELEKLQRMVLTAVTMSDGLGFNRAILLLVDEDENVLRGVMGVGPSDVEEAWHIWDKLSLEQKTLREVMHEIDVGPMRKDSFLDRLSMGVEVSLKDDTILTRAVKKRRAYNVLDVKKEKHADPVLIQQLGTEAYAVVPLIARNKVTGALWVDNLFNKRKITDEDMKFIAGFSDQVASAIEAARLFQQVSLAEAELENIFRSISDLVFFTDKDYTIKKVNQAVVNKVGLTAEEIIGRKCYEIFHGTDRPWHMCPHMKTIETLKPQVAEIEDDYLIGTYLTSTSPTFDLDGKFLGTVHVVRDVTELKELQNKLQSTERMAALGEVAAKVAHEIRNPLVSVGGFAKRLENRLDGELREYAGIIAKEVGRLEDILKDILGFVREVRMSRQIVDLNSIVVEIMEFLGNEFAEHGNRTVKELSGTVLEVDIDPNRMKEAILNIVANANQSTDGGTITVRTFGEKGNAVVEVTDTGCGITPDDLTRIFDPFFTTRPAGTGLGLAIAKRIIEEHDGSISAKSGLPEGGSKFIILIPLTKGGAS